MPTPRLDPTALPAPMLYGIYSERGFRIETRGVREDVIAATETILTLFTEPSPRPFRERFNDSWQMGGSTRRYAIMLAAMVDGAPYVAQWHAEDASNLSLREATFDVILRLLRQHFGPIDPDMTGINEVTQAIRKSHRHFRNLDSSTVYGTERFLPLTDRVSVELGSGTSDRAFVNVSPDHLQFGEGLRWVTPVKFRIGDRTVRVDQFGNCQIDEGDRRVFNLRSVNVAQPGIARDILTLLMLNAPSLTARACANFCAANCGRSFFGGIMTTPGSRRCGMTVRMWRLLYRDALSFTRFTAFASNFPRPVRNWRESDARFHGTAYPAATARVIRRRARLWNWNAIPTDVAAIMARDLELHLEDPTE